MLALLITATAYGQKEFLDSFDRPETDWQFEKSDELGKWVHRQPPGQWRINGQSALAGEKDGKDNQYAVLFHDDATLAPSRIGVDITLPIGDKDVMAGIVARADDRGNMYVIRLSLPEVDPFVQVVSWPAGEEPKTIEGGNIFLDRQFGVTLEAGKTYRLEVELIRSDAFRWMILLDGVVIAEGQATDRMLSFEPGQRFGLYSNLLGRPAVFDNFKAQ